MAEVHRVGGRKLDEAVFRRFRPAHGHEAVGVERVVFDVGDRDVCLETDKSARVRADESRVVATRGGRIVSGEVAGLEAGHQFPIGRREVHVRERVDWRAVDTDGLRDVEVLSAVVVPVGQAVRRVRDHVEELARGVVGEVGVRDRHPEGCAYEVHDASLAEPHALVADLRGERGGGRRRVREIEAHHAGFVVAGVEERHLARAVHAQQARLSDAPPVRVLGDDDGIRPHPHPAARQAVAHGESDLVVDAFRAVAGRVARSSFHAEVRHEVAVGVSCVIERAGDHRRIGHMIGIPGGTGGVRRRQHERLVAQCAVCRLDGMVDAVHHHAAVDVAAVEHVPYARVNQCRWGITVESVRRIVVRNRHAHDARLCHETGGGGNRHENLFQTYHEKLLL